jgi:dipeptidyl aminopeptidase/acylaminoacyl peptidase
MDASIAEGAHSRPTRAGRAYHRCMTQKKTLPYGSWPSPITVDMAVGAARGLSEPRQDGEDIYFLESRPDEAGRVVLVRRSADGGFTDMAPGLNVRTRVHEYGGGAYTVHDGRIVFSEFVGNRLMLKMTPDAEAAALVDDPALRFADMEPDPRRERVLVVMEDQHPSALEARNLICAVSLADGAITELAVGHDFYSDPRLSPDGTRLAWLTWDFPQMPWDGTDLWVAEVVEDSSLGEPVHVAGGPSESVAQPKWAPDGSLVYVSDRNDWWNLYHWREGATGSAEVAPMEAEFAGPQWVFGLSDYDIDADGTIVAFAAGRGRSRLLSLGPGVPPQEIEVDAGSVEYVRVRDGIATFIGGSPTTPSALVRLDTRTGTTERLREASRLGVDPAYLSIPRHIEYATSDGRTAYGWFYPPTNPDAEAPAGEKPPLVVMIHGGPTSCATTRLSLARQAFTSRGFAIVDVDYGGSTGYGRAFRDQLRESWGVVDLEDCTNAALWLAGQGIVDPDRLVIRGGSAGGYTTLAALTFKDVFSAGTSFYGLGDLVAFTDITHKFESRYMDILVGPFPEKVARYRERSPIQYADRIACPVLVMQGADDLIVPVAQAEQIVDALERNGLPHAYLLFEGEGHGFRMAANQRRALEAELSFYAQVFGFELADDFEPLEVRGLGG